MKKRIVAALLTAFGVLSVAGAVLWGLFAVKSKPSLDIIGGANWAFILRYYNLYGAILLLAVGGGLLLAARILCLVRRKRPNGRADAGASRREEQDDSGEPPGEPLPDASDGSADPAASEKADNPAAVPPSDVPPTSPVTEPVRVYHSRIMGATVVGNRGRNRQQVLASLLAGDMLVCRSSPRADDAAAIGLFTVSGEQVGYLDSNLVGEIKVRYPHHRIGAILETVRGGNGSPLTGEIRVTVYRVAP